jgi:hypothetical protein
MSRTWNRIGSRSYLLIGVAAVALSAAAWLAPGGRAYADQSYAVTRTEMELPFAEGSRWVVMAPASERRPDRTTAWAVFFAPIDGSETAVIAPAGGRIRVIDMRPSMIPVWCDSQEVWTGPQREVQIDVDDQRTVVVGYLDDLAVESGDEVVLGQHLGTLSASGCGAVRALGLALWRREPNGVRSEPFGAISGYQDDDLYPGRDLDGTQR